MGDLATTYMGIVLRNPVVAAASAISNKIDNIKRVEEAGAGALVIRSLFEEQIRHEISELDDALTQGGESYAESLSYFPKIRHAEATDHLRWVERAREAVKMPLIASLNAVTPGKWGEYARKLADTGVDGLELNYYTVEAGLTACSSDSEQRLFDTFESVRSVVKLPIAVKLSPFYTCMGSVVQGLEARGANAVVLFNRFFQPDINPETEALFNQMTYSTETEMRLPLRWVALLYGRVLLDLAGNTGIATGEDVVKFVLAGATVVQVASCLFRNGIKHIGTLVDGLNTWMDAKGYAAVEDFRGKVSQQGFDGDPSLFERAQYLGFLMQRDQA
jgi:dihydroorotate dehydrogenase (fumarate)